MERKCKRNRLLWMMFLFLFLTGCGATELEESCFPLMVAVGYEEAKVSYALGFPRVGSSGEKEPQINEIQVPQVLTKSFKESKETYESHLNKIVDYNHLKVIVLEEDFVEQQECYDAMLEELSKEEEFPRNTYVCVVEDVEDLMEIDKNLPQELGTYLEEYLNHHEDKKDHLLTLGNLMDEKENKEMILYVPYLETEDNYVEWGGYYAMGQGQPPIDFE